MTLAQKSRLSLVVQTALGVQPHVFRRHENSTDSRVDFESKTGAIGNRRPFVYVPTSTGKPDGLAIDREGGLWVAIYGGSSVFRYSRDGGLDTLIHLASFKHN